MTVELWECAPLRAKITEPQCQWNRRKAENASPFLHSRIRLTPTAAAHCLGLGACLGCPGVRALASGQRPNVLDGDALVRRAKHARPIRGVIAGSPAGRPLRIQKRQRSPLNFHPAR